MTERILVTDDAPGLGHMLADLVRGNLEAHPDRADLLGGVAGHVNIHATDAEVEVGLVFSGAGLTIGSPINEPEIAIACDSVTLLELSTVPLRFGRPDVATPEGRAVVGKLLRGELSIKGMFTHPRLLSHIQRLLSVA